MGNNFVPKFIFRLSRFPVYRGSVLGSFYCIINLRASKHARFLWGYAPLAESLGFDAPRTRLHPLLPATTKVALPRDHERGRARYSCTILMKLEFSGQIFEKKIYTNISNFMKIRPVGGRVLACGLTDKHDEVVGFAFLRGYLINSGRLMLCSELHGYTVHQ